LLENKAVIVK